MCVIIFRSITILILRTLKLIKHKIIIQHCCSGTEAVSIFEVFNKDDEKGILEQFISVQETEFASEYVFI